MNTIDLLDKLNLPKKIGLDYDDALLNQKTIMDAYLSAASLQFHRQLFTNDNMFGWGNYDGGCLSLNQFCSDLAKQSSVDLFRMLGSERVITENKFEDETETKIVLDLKKIAEQNMDLPTVSNMMQMKCQEVSQSQELADTESESYTKLEIEHNKKAERKGKGKNSDISKFVNEQRRRLLKKLDSCEDNRIIFKMRLKNSKKDLTKSADNYRGSRYWGVSKNKSKWQVTNINRNSLINIIGNDYLESLQGVQRWI